MQDRPSQTKKGTVKMDKFTDILYDYADVDEIEDNMEFKKDLGLSSFDTVCLIADIRKKLGAEISPSDFIMYKTVGAMRSYINSLF